MKENKDELSEEDQSEEVIRKSHRLTRKPKSNHKTAHELEVEKLKSFRVTRSKVSSGNPLLQGKFKEAQTEILQHADNQLDEANAKDHHSDDEEERELREIQQQLEMEKQEIEKKKTKEFYN